MRFVTAGEFTAERPWGAIPLAALDDATVRLHWTDTEYVWHTNDGVEVFVVIDGEVDMHYRDRSGKERVRRLTPGVVCIADVGDEHKAAPVGQARIVVVEKAGSI
ncbi:hypothetical protein [Tsukamurella sp. 1534]|uniref:hypothetical protein n=1 Tax=Tsukamurella sp. 1534 TaxID=1151061 RepID=UPI0003184A1B|nr:hypothetical protein [Tsukamurella sp. 1534]